MQDCTAHSDADSFAPTPRWITDDLIQYTIRVWQKYYGHPLTREDSLSILQHVGHVLDLVALDRS